MLGFKPRPTREFVLITGNKKRAAPARLRGDENVV
jgi:hypothetical protein